MSAARHRAEDDIQPISGRPDGSDYPRRRSQRPSQPGQQGWRASKRSTKLGKRVRREARAEELKARVNDGVRATKNGFIGIVQIVGLTIATVVALTLVLGLLVYGVNAGARWYARQQAEREATPEARAAKARENLLIIGEDGTTADFLAVRLDEEGRQITGIAIPGGAFMEVPGQGYERVGDSYTAGPDISLAAISNYLSVPFADYVVVDVAVYQDAVSNHSLRDVMANVTESSLTADEREKAAEFIDSVDGARSTFAPLPVKPIDLGGQTYYEPQRDKIADLLLQWWGVKMGAEDTTVRVIVYNGAGTPRVAGAAAQELIAAGMRVIDTKNADRFDYATTLVVVQDGDLEQGELVKAALGVGEIVDKPSDQDVADVIVIIGKDYEPPATTDGT